MAYSFQTFTNGTTLTSSNMNQMEVNVRDHLHGVDGVQPSPIMKDRANVTSAEGAQIIRSTISGDVLAFRDITDSSDVAKIDNGGNYLLGIIPFSRLARTQRFTGPGSDISIPHATNSTVVGTLDMGIVMSGDILSVWANGYLTKHSEGDPQGDRIARCIVSKLSGNAAISAISALTDFIRQDFYTHSGYTETITVRGFFQVTSTGSLSLSSIIESDLGSATWIGGFSALTYN